MDEEKTITIVRSEKQERALELISRGETDTQVAKKLGVTRQTLYNWRNLDDRFMKALEERRNLMREHAKDRLLELSDEAIQAVKEALGSKDERIRLQAAKMVLVMMNKGKDEKENSPLLSLLSEAIGGIKGQLGIEK